MKRALSEHRNSTAAVSSSALPIRPIGNSRPACSGVMPSVSPRRRNRRTPLIEAALEPARHQFKPAALRDLTRALALIVGPEALIVVKDVLQPADADARRIKRWIVRVPIGAAKQASRIG